MPREDNSTSKPTVTDTMLKSHLHTILAKLRAELDEHVVFKSDGKVFLKKTDGKFRHLKGSSGTSLNTLKDYVTAPELNFKYEDVIKAIHEADQVLSKIVEVKWFSIKETHPHALSTILETGMLRLPEIHDVIAELRVKMESLDELVVAMDRSRRETTAQLSREVNRVSQLEKFILENGLTPPQAKVEENQEEDSSLTNQGQDWSKFNFTTFRPAGNYGAPSVSTVANEAMRAVIDAPELSLKSYYFTARTNMMKNTVILILSLEKQLMALSAKSQKEPLSDNEEKLVISGQEAYQKALRTYCSLIGISSDMKKLVNEKPMDEIFDSMLKEDSIALYESIGFKGYVTATRQVQAAFKSLKKTNGKFQAGLIDSGVLADGQGKECIGYDVKNEACRAKISVMGIVARHKPKSGLFRVDANGQCVDRGLLKHHARAARLDASTEDTENTPPTMQQI